MSRIPPAWARDGDDSMRLVEAGVRKLEAEVAQERLHARVTGSWPLDPERAVREFSDEQRALRRLSPRRNRWKEIGEFDSRIAALEQKQANVSAELAAAREQLEQARRHDGETLARWVASNQGARPLPTAPGVEQRIADLTADHEALTTAVGQVLAEKAGYVERHRRRLVKDAEKARRRAVEGLQQAVTALEQAREKAVDAVAMQSWAIGYPDGEKADPTELRLHLLKGGRVTDALPDFKGLAVMSQLVEWLRQDASWLDSVLAEQEQRELDPHEQPIWEESEEGRKAMQLANKRIAATLAPRNVHTAGWGD